MRIRFVVLAAIVAVVSACSSGPSATDRLVDNVAAQGEAQEALRQRFDDLEAQLQSVRTNDPQTELRGLASLLEELTATVTGLASDLETNATQDAGRDDAVAQVRAGLDELAQTVGDLRATIETLDDELARVGDLVAEHVDDPAAHVVGPVD
jgi:chromosome segregation ATPase